MINFRWMEFGGIYLDLGGDIAVTQATSLGSLREIIQSRLKAALHGWKIYSIGADLEAGLWVPKPLRHKLSWLCARRVQRYNVCKSSLNS